MENKSKIYNFTKENIVKDYEVIFKKKIVTTFIKLFIFVAYYAFMAWLISLVPIVILINIISNIVLAATGVYILWYYIKNIIELYKNRKAILNGDYRVTTEKVVNTFKKERRLKFLFLGLFLNPVLVFVFIEPIPYRLLFGGLGEYKILNGQYYGSSQIYEMNEQGVFNRASAGDEHYLVLCGENIALVYNRKMFEYKENV